jgi:hypothetical protein
MNRNILLVFRPLDKTKDCHVAEFDDWDEIITSCETVNKRKGITKDRALAQLGLDQEAIDIFEFPIMTISDVIKALKGDSILPGPRRDEAHQLFRKMCFLDFPHLHFNCLGETQSIEVNSIKLVSSNSQPNIWTVEATFPDDGERFPLCSLATEKAKPFIQMIESLTWIDKEPGFFPSKSAFLKRVESALKKAA